MAKFGAIIGNRCRLAYGVLLGPGAIIARRCDLYPGVVLSERHIPDDVVVNADRTQVLIKRRGAESNLPEGVGRRSQWIVVAPTGIGVTHEGRGHEVSGRTPPARRVAVSSRTGGSLQRDGIAAC